MPSKKSKIPQARKPRRSLSARSPHRFPPPKLPDKDQLETISMTPLQQVSENLWVTYIRAPNSITPEERWYIVFHPTEMITTREWISAAPIVMAAMEALTRSQGSDLRNYIISVMAQYDEWKWKKREAYGYGTLAQDQNFNALALVRMLNDSSSDSVIHDFAEFYLHSLFRTFAFDEREITSLLLDAHDELAKGKLPWTPWDGPVTVAKARQAWTTHKNQLKSQKRVYHGRFPSVIAYLLEHMLILSGHWQAIATRLEKDYPEQFKAYRERLEERFKVIERLSTPLTYRKLFALRAKIAKRAMKKT